MSSAARLVVVAGAKESGKKDLLEKVRSIGASRFDVVPKLRSPWLASKGHAEPARVGDALHALERCDLQYEGHEVTYGVRTGDIWAGLNRGRSQVLAVSSPDAIRRLKQTFGQLAACVFVHSEADAVALRGQPQYNSATAHELPAFAGRLGRHWLAHQMYVRNIDVFDAVLINVGSTEDLFDQLDRLVHRTAV